MLHSNSDSYHYILSILVSHDKLDNNVNTFARIVGFPIPMLRVSKMLIDPKTLPLLEQLKATGVPSKTLPWAERMELEYL